MNADLVGAPVLPVLVVDDEEEPRRATTRLLQSGGLPQSRVYEVAGKAASEPLLPENPTASANRRLSIVLLKEAPPAPSGGPLGN